MKRVLFLCYVCGVVALAASAEGAGCISRTWTFRRCGVQCCWYIQDGDPLEGGGGLIWACWPIKCGGPPPTPSPPSYPPFA